MRYINLEKEKKNATARMSWKKVLALLVTVMVVAGVALYAYDGDDWGGEYEIYTYGSYVDYIADDVPYWDYYMPEDTFSCPPPTK